MSSEAMKDRVEKALSELIVAVANETRQQVTADINDRLQKAFGGGFKIAIDTETTGVDGNSGGSVTFVDGPVESRPAKQARKGTAGQAKPKKKRKVTAKFRAAIVRNLKLARAKRAENLKKEKASASKRVTKRKKKK